MSETSLKLYKHKKQLFNQCLNFLNSDFQTSQKFHQKNEKNWHYFDNIVHLREFRNTNLMKNTLVKEDGIWKLNKIKVRSQVTKNVNFLFSLDDFQYQLNKNNFRLKTQSNNNSRLKEYHEIYNSRRKLSLFYGYFSTKKLKKLMNQAKKYPGYFAKNFFSLLEQRLDVALYRSGLTPSVIAARQLCLHGKVKLNSHICTMSNVVLKPGDIVSVDLQYLNERNQQNLIENNKLTYTQIKTTHSNYSHLIPKNQEIKVMKNLIIGSNCIRIISKSKIENHQKLRFDLFLRFLSASLRSKLSKRMRNRLQLKYNILTNSSTNVTELFLKLRHLKKPKFLLKTSNLNNTRKNNQKNILISQNSLSNNLTRINLKNNVIVDNLKNNIVFHFLNQFSQSSLLRKKSLLYSFQNNLISSNLKKRGTLPTNLEISSKVGTFVYLFAPQRIQLPFILNIDTLKKLLRI